MKYSSIFAGIALLASGVVAQIPGLPDCAQSCVSIPQECQTTDFKCICSDRNFITTISCCVAQKCSPSDQQTVIKFASSLCGNYQVSLPTTATCPASATQTAGASPAAAGVNGSVATMTVTTTKTSVMANAGAGAWLPDILQAGGLAGAVAGVMALL